LALLVSLAALLVSGGALVYTVRTYRRSGARVAVSVEKKIGVGSYVGGPMFSDVLSVLVSNKGLASTQIANVFFEVEGRLGFVEVDPSGPRLPCVLAGMHQESWAPTLLKVLRGADADGDEAVRVRAGVVLGDQTQRRSGWVSISQLDLQS
jgi:hypothetical protein